MDKNNLCNRCKKQNEDLRCSHKDFTKLEIVRSDVRDFTYDNIVSCSGSDVREQSPEYIESECSCPLCGSEISSKSLAELNQQPIKIDNIKIGMNIFIDSEYKGRVTEIGISKRDDMVIFYFLPPAEFLECDYRFTSIGKGMQVSLGEMLYLEEANKISLIPKTSGEKYSFSKFDESKKLNVREESYHV